MSMRPYRLLAAIITLAIMTGCMFIDNERLPEDAGDDTKPWNEPSPWENTVPGMSN